MPRDHLRLTADVLLDVWKELGPLVGIAPLPGAPLIRHALDALESLRKSQDARRRLEDLLGQAEQEFLREAPGQGLDRVADWVRQLPFHDLDSFRQALKALRDHWDEQALRDRLAQELARIPNLGPGEQARALALYLDCLRRRLLADPEFRPIVLALSALRVEKDLERLLEEVDALYRALNRLIGLPEDLVAWPVETLDAAAVRELRADLLLPRYRLVPYTGKAFRQTLEDLLAWARGLEAARPPVGLRIYIGPGGAGKTRLLIEAGEALRREGWWTGFLRAGRLTPANARLLTADARPTLLIADYIANRPDEARTLLREAARACRERTAPLALVLLERAFPEWLQKDLQDYTDPEYVGWPAFLGLPTVEKRPRALPALDPEDRRALFREARARLAALLPADGRSLPDYDELPESPLHVLLLALLTAAGERVDRPADPERVLECAWSRERAAWERHLDELLRGQPEPRRRRALEIVEDLSVLATLGRPFPSKKAVADFLEAHSDSFEPIHGVAWRELANLLPKLFPRAEKGVIPPIVPDPLADFVLMRRLTERPELVPMALPAPEEAGAGPEEAVGAARQALEALARLWGRAKEEGERRRVEDWMRAAAGRLAEWPPAAWRALAAALPAPDRTLALRPFLADFCRARLERTPREEPEERARLAHMLGVALFALGRRAEALQATQEAVEIRRRLAAQRPDAFLPDLAMSLTNLGADLSALGRRAEALQATQEAVALYRRLAAQHPDAFLPHLAVSLNNLSVWLSEMGRQAEALQAAQEAAALYRRLAAQHPDAFLPYLAGSFHTLGKVLSKMGRRAEALEATQEAVALYRRLAAQHPDAFLPDLALSLINLGADLSALGQREEALEATQEAVTLYRRLAAQHPDAFLPDLALSLNNLGLQLSEMGQREEALEATQEAVDLYRRLAAQHPDAFLPHLAMSLNNLGAMLSESGRRAEALQATQEAVEIRRRLATQHPDAFLPDLAVSLNNLGNRLSEMGRRAEALQATQEAVDLYRRLAAQHPDAFLPDLARSLQNLGVDLSALGRRAEALEATQEAVDLYRRLAAQHPDAFLPDLAMSLHNLGDRLSEIGEPEKALAAYEEAVRILLPFFRVLPPAFADRMRYMLRDYLAACGRGKREPDWELVKETLRVGLSLALSPTATRLAPLLWAVVAMARGLAEPETSQRVEEDLAEMRQQEDWQGLAEALERLLTGERDPQALRRGLALDAIDEQALALAEGAVADEEMWALLGRLASEAGGAE
ncbi:tetratricopeptide repeat protein [Thermoflexus sp.]|uniref:tetratricopeptide repeat protein n=1 Tax=Thermoflexus sp. TaxID=1969742 RepID=UPI002ADE1E7F|nr:tetratricopeptide repeat protein [Thermoflexus sp.]